MGMLSKLFGPEPKFKRPRVWSNSELRKLGKLVTGSVVNVSGWKDEDKEGGYYKDYFPNRSEYKITNYSSVYKGFQGGGDEIGLDLTAPLAPELVGRFDTVFNHTTLEHIFEVHTAFGNLAKMSKQYLLVVVPFLQQQHGPEYGDYWRFTPLAMKNLMETNGLRLAYLSYNDSDRDSIYIVALGTKNTSSPFDHVPGNQAQSVGKSYIGTKIIRRRFMGFPIG